MIGTLLKTVNSESKRKHSLVMFLSTTCRTMKCNETCKKNRDNPCIGVRKMLETIQSHHKVRFNKVSHSKKITLVY